MAVSKGNSWYSSSAGLLQLLLLLYRINSAFLKQIAFESNDRTGVFPSS